MNNLLNYFTEVELKNLIKIDNLYLKAEIIITKLFKDKYDKEGKPYIGHLYRVSGKLNEEIEKVVGLLHDTIEDTEITSKDLLQVGFPIEVIEIIKLVTKEKTNKKLTHEEKLVLYDNEINNIINSGNIHAIRLKEADMSDNCDEERLSKLSEEQQAWFHKKYDKQLIKLRNVKGMIK